MHTNFPLLGAHGGTACTGCHTAGKPYRATPQQCSGCHASRGSAQGLARRVVRGLSHVQRRGSRPTSITRRRASRSRARTAKRFARDCHRNQQFAGTSTQCVGCHQSEDKHAGRNGVECGSCHSPTAWAVSFDHATAAGFRLAGKHQQLKCEGCHTKNLSVALPKTCVGCHQKDDPHQGKLGTSCGDCHSRVAMARDELRSRQGLGLRAERRAPRARVHDVSRERRRRAARANSARAATPRPIRIAASSARSAKAATRTRVGSWPSASTTGWRRSRCSASTRRSRAADCHASAAFHDAGAACTDCHASDDPHQGHFKSECSTCHNPSGWQAWLFDHDKADDLRAHGRAPRSRVRHLSRRPIPHERDASAGRATTARSAIGATIRIRASSAPNAARATAPSPSPICEDANDAQQARGFCQSRLRCCCSRCCPAPRRRRSARRRCSITSRRRSAWTARTSSSRARAATSTASSPARPCGAAAVMRRARARARRRNPCSTSRTTELCDSCHRTTGWVPVVAVDHVEVFGSCASCHDNEPRARQARESPPDQQPMRRLPPHRGVLARGIRPRRHLERLLRLPQRHAGVRQAGGPHSGDQHLRGLPQRHQLLARGPRGSHAGARRLLGLPQQRDRDGAVPGAHPDRDDRMRRVPQHDGVGPAVSVGRLRSSLGAVAAAGRRDRRARGGPRDRGRAVREAERRRARRDRLRVPRALPEPHAGVRRRPAGADRARARVRWPSSAAACAASCSTRPRATSRGVKQVVFDTTVEDRVARVAINVGRIVRFAVSQGPMRNVLRVELDQTDAAAQQGERVPDLRAERAAAGAHSARIAPSAASRPPRRRRHPRSPAAPVAHRAPSRRRLPRPSAGRCGSCSRRRCAPNAS